MQLCHLKNLDTKEVGVGVEGWEGEWYSENIEIYVKIEQSDENIRAAANCEWNQNEVNKGF